MPQKESTALESCAAKEGSATIRELSRPAVSGGMTGGAERDEVFRGIIAGKLRNCLWWTTSRRTIDTANRRDAAPALPGQNLVNLAQDKHGAAAIELRVLKHLTLIIRGGRIEHAFYPVFPPNQRADQVVRWLRGHQIS
jgi:hypothetical protein